MVSFVNGIDLFYPIASSPEWLNAVIVFRTKIIICFYFWTIVALNAQEVDSLHWLSLPEVEVSTHRLHNYAIGQQIKQIDSNVLRTYPMQNLAEVLSEQSAIYLKNYGPGRLNTTSIRGASASQTAIIWNGIPLLQPMLGQFDLSLFPAFFMDQIALQAGGGSSLWGSGAVGGSIHFNSPPEYQKGWNLSWQSLTGSFQHYNNGWKVQYSNGKFSNSSRFFYEQAENDFPFTNQNGERNPLANAQVRQKGFLQENGYRINERQHVKWHLWWQESDRSIPPIIGQLQGQARQKDQAIRALLDWQYNGDLSVWNIKTAFFEEQLNYDDSLASIHSKSKARVAQTQVEWTRQLAPRWQLNSNAQYRFLWAQSTAYPIRQQQNQLALFASLKWQANDHWTAVLSTRQEWIDGQLSPLLPALAFEGKLSKAWQLKGSISRNFRLPTFNDLYWSPGGNPDLTAEQGWSEELSLSYQANRQTPFLSLTAYNRNIRDWIIWLPEGSVWSPNNILEVWSRGIEAAFRQNFTWSTVQASLQSKYHFTLSTNQKAKSSNDLSVGKQLIYQPRHQGQINLNIQWKNWQMTYHHQITGKVFLLADHSAELPAFQVGNLQLSHSFERPRFRGRLQFNIRNIWNADYQVVANRPMPGRYFELGTNINFKP